MDTRIINLFRKYVNAQCNPQELDEVFAILESGQFHAEWQQVIHDEADHVLSSGLQTELSQAEVDEIYEGIAARLPSAKKRSYKLWPRIAIAAAVTMVMASAGIWFYKADQKPTVTDQVAVVNAIVPGKQGATLTLANGTKIRLTDANNGELAKQSGVVISKSANGQLVYEIKNPRSGSGKDATGKEGLINTLSTAKGETYQVRLPDGSRVWLNAASSLTYAANLLAGGRRRVKLEGEGYFEIVKDKAHPFLVESNGQELEVLGTHFNIMAYHDENVVRTTLLKGAVRISGKDGAQKVTLKPGQQAERNKASNHLYISAVDTEAAVAWKNGLFQFKNENIQSIMRKVSRWYDVEVVFTDKNTKDKNFGGTFSRFAEVSDVLNTIELTGVMHFKIEGRRIIVMP